MKHLFRISSFFIAFSLFTALFTTRVDATEGIFQLRSTNREPYRCYASSIMMQDATYTVLVSCRDLIYPADDRVFYYVLWATPQDGGNPIRLGDLGFGRLGTEVKIPFTNLFVTTESDDRARVPSGTVVMRGNAERIAFLDRGTTNTPTPNTTVTATQDSNSDQSQQDVTPTPEEEGASTGEKLMIALRRAGLAAFLALIAIIGLIFAITRARG